MKNKSTIESDNLNLKFVRKNKGITLIALIITIILLLILSSLTIATLTGENGLFARAKQAKVAQTEADMKENLNLVIQELQVEKLAVATLDDITQEWLTSKLSEYSPILKEDGTTNSKKVTLQKNGIIKTYMIDENLNITEVENESGIDFSYEIVKRENGKVKILIKVQDSENGINKVEVPGDAIILNGTREQRGIDQEIEVGTEYTYKVISVSGKEREETILIEPEIIVGEAYIGTSTTDTNASNSVANNSQTRGTTLYVNFTATLEKFGTACTVKLKGGADSDTLPYAITKNGTYTFVVTGTYGNNKTITKEVEINVDKYKVVFLNTKNFGSRSSVDGWTTVNSASSEGLYGGPQKQYPYCESNEAFDLTDINELNFYSYSTISNNYDWGYAKIQLLAVEDKNLTIDSDYVEVEKGATSIKLDTSNITGFYYIRIRLRCGGSSSDYGSVGLYGKAEMFGK